MRCNICGYNSLKNFTVCPYCGKTRNIIVNPADNNSNIYNNDSQVNLLVQNSSKKIPKGYSKIQSGFKFTQCVKYGEFYQNYLLFDVFILVIFVSVFLYISFNEEKFFLDKSTIFVVALAISFVFYLLTNCLYNLIFNSVTFIVDQNGIYIKSLLKKYFIEKENIKDLKFEFITRKFDVFYLFNSSGKKMRKRMFGRSFNDSEWVSSYDSHIDSSSGNEKMAKRQGYNIFFYVENPIFINDIFVSEEKKYLHLVNTGISFISSLEAKFLLEEFKRVLNIYK